MYFALAQVTACPSSREFVVFGLDRVNFHLTLDSSLNGIFAQQYTHL